MSASMWIKNGSAAILAFKRSAGVTPEVNVRNPLHTGGEAGFETQDRRDEKSKTGVQQICF